MSVLASLNQVNKREVVVGDSTVVGALALHAAGLGLIPNTIYSPSDNNRSERSARNQPLSTAGSVQNSTESVVVLLIYKELLY